MTEFAKRFHIERLPFGGYYIALRATDSAVIVNDDGTPATEHSTLSMGPALARELINHYERNGCKV